VSNEREKSCPLQWCKGRLAREPRPEKKRTRGLRRSGKRGKMARKDHPSEGGGDFCPSTGCGGMGEGLPIAMGRVFSKGKEKHSGEKREIERSRGASRSGREEAPLFGGGGSRPS